MVVWLVMFLAVSILTEAAIPDPPTSGITTVGSLKIGTAADCAGVVAFSATQASVDHAKVVFAETLVDKGVGYVAQTGVFITHCPGLYQFSFAGYGSTDLRLTLKKKLNNSDSWRPVVSTGAGGGANLVLLDVEAGDHLAVFVDAGYQGEFLGVGGTWNLNEDKNPDAEIVASGVLVGFFIYTSVVLITYCFGNSSHKKTLVEIIMNFVGTFMFIAVGGTALHYWHGYQSENKFDTIVQERQVGLAVGSLCVIEGAAYLVDLILSVLHFAKSHDEYLE